MADSDPTQRPDAANSIQQVAGRDAHAHITNDNRVVYALFAGSSSVAVIVAFLLGWLFGLLSGLFIIGIGWLWLERGAAEKYRPTAAARGPAAIGLVTTVSLSALVPYTIELARSASSASTLASTCPSTTASILPVVSGPSGTGSVPPTTSTSDPPPTLPPPVETASFACELQEKLCAPGVVTAEYICTLAAQAADGTDVVVRFKDQSKAGTTTFSGNTAVVSVLVNFTTADDNKARTLTATYGDKSVEYSAKRPACEAKPFKMACASKPICSPTAGFTHQIECQVANVSPGAKVTFSSTSFGFGSATVTADKAGKATHSKAIQGESNGSMSVSANAAGISSSSSLKLGSCK